MSNKRDYYEVVGVPSEADEKTIKKAYRKKAMQYHPDRYDGPKEEAEEKFKELNEAYQVLSDPEKRQMYDQFGHAGLDQTGFQAQGGDPFDFFSQVFNMDLSDLFGGGGFGRSRRSRRSQSGPQRGDDVILDLELSYEDAYTGVSKKITMPFNAPCKNCNGRRAAPGTDFKTCRNCGGAGVVEKQSRQGFFVQINRTPCSKCNGSGQVPEKVCSECKGSGRSNKKEKIKVKIPKGVDSGEHIRVQGKGRPSPNGGMPGDLIFRIHMKENHTWERNGLDVYTKIPVDYPTMVLGGEIKVPILGKENSAGKLKVPSGTELNDVLRLSGKGFERKVRGSDVQGDAYYVVDLEVPKKVSRKQKQLLKELQETMN